jgi:hypothetical protein
MTTALKLIRPRKKNIWTYGDLNLKLKADYCTVGLFSCGPGGESTHNGLDQPLGVRHQGCRLKAAGDSVQAVRAARRVHVYIRRSA